MGLLAGCAALSQPTRAIGPPSVVDSDQSENQGWWFVRFRMDRVEDVTRWERDLLIAHRVMAPILDDYGQEIRLWRFHRRSADDETGHQFSFIFFASRETADAINRRVAADALVKRMLADAVVREVLVDDGEQSLRVHIGDTSDPNWSPVMRDSWPIYIMGVSRMWLDMIDRCSREIGIAGDATLDQLIDHYQAVDAAVTHIWQQEAYHALLHHLNAIYEYKPLIYWEKKLKQF